MFIYHNNYLYLQQAALFIHKGEDNAKFETTQSEIAYQIIYHPAYYWFNLLTAVALLILALKEEPSVHTDQHAEEVELVSVLIKKRSTFISHY